MNKIILIVVALMYVTTGHSKPTKATLYMEDGEEKIGFAEMVEVGDSKVIFRIDEKAKKEVILSSAIRKIEYTDEAGNQYLAERLYLMAPNAFNSKYSKSKEKKWFYIIYDKGVKIGCTTYEGNIRYNAVQGTTAGQFGDTTYYFGTAESDELFFGYLKSSAGLAIHTQTGSNIKKMSEAAFANCPELIQEIEKEDFKTKTAVDQLIVIFEKVKCN